MKGVQPPVAASSRHNWIPRANAGDKGSICSPCPSSHRSPERTTRVRGSTISHRISHGFAPSALANRPRFAPMVFLPSSAGTPASCEPSPAHAAACPTDRTQPPSQSPSQGTSDVSSGCLPTAKSSTKAALAVRLHHSHVLRTVRRSSSSKACPTTVQRSATPYALRARFPWAGCTRSRRARRLQPRRATRPDDPPP